MVLRVEGDGGAGLARLGTDGAGVLVGDLLVEDLAEGGELEADLGGGGQLGGVQGVEQPQVFVSGRLGLLGVGGVLTQVVDGDGQSVGDELAGAL